MAKDRATIEARRGIVRDENGRIVRDKDFHKEQIEMLKQRIEDCDTRKENAKRLIEEHREAIKNFGRDTSKASKKNA